MLEAIAKRSLSQMDATKTWLPFLRVSTRLLDLRAFARFSDKLNRQNLVIRSISSWDFSRIAKLDRLIQFSYSRVFFSKKVYRIIDVYSSRWNCSISFSRNACGWRTDVIAEQEPAFSFRRFFRQQYGFGGRPSNGLRQTVSKRLFFQGVESNRLFHWIFQPHSFLSCKNRAKNADSFRQISTRATVNEESSENWMKRTRRDEVKYVFSAVERRNVRTVQEPDRRPVQPFYPHNAAHKKLRARVVKINKGSRSEQLLNITFQFR